MAEIYAGSRSRSEMMPLQPMLIQSALWLQFPPFTWLFKAYYGLAVLL